MTDEILLSIREIITVGMALLVFLSAWKAIKRRK